MKLRIKGNSLRLRLSQTEVERLRDDGRVVDAIDFGNERLVYEVVSEAAAKKVSAAFAGNRIAVSIPELVVREWATTEQVGIESSQAVANGELRILIEKDFACLSPRGGDDDSDAFANPLSGIKEC